MLPNLTIQLKKFIIKLTKLAKYERSGATSCYMAIGEKKRCSYTNTTKSILTSCNAISAGDVP